MNAQPPRKKSRLLLAGNHSCGNRGDAAILRGLVEVIEELAPDVEVTVTSRFPTSSTYLLGREVVPDLTHDWPASARIRPYRLKKFVIGQLTASLEAELAGRRKPYQAIPAAVQEIIESLCEYDAMIQVGGSFFVDLYGDRQYETPFCAMLAGIPVFLAGHSMGPFEEGRSRQFAKTLLSRCNHTYLREETSLELLREAGLPLGKVTLAADTAWLVSRPAQTPERLAELFDWTAEGSTIAITVRDLAPFDRRLGISQDQFEAAFADLCSSLIADGHKIVAASTCTGIENYRDDRIAALRIAARVNRPEAFRVVMDELNDVELGQLLGRCRLLVGTRLHSAIIAMNFGTPAIALNYEHKSAGTMRNLGLPQLSVPVDRLVDGSLKNRVPATLDQLPEIAEQMQSAAEAERAKARSMIEEILHSTGLSGRSTPVEDAPIREAAV